MARPASSNPTRSVLDVIDKATGQVTAFRWSTFFMGPNGVPVRKEGKVSVDTVLRRLGPKAKRDKAVKEAESQAYAAMEGFIAGRTSARQSVMTLQKWSEYCLDTVLPMEGKKPRSIDEISKALRRHVYGQLGAIPLSHLTPEICLAWWKVLIESEHTRTYRNKHGEVTRTSKKRMSYKTAVNIKIYLGTVMDRAVRMGRVQFNPVHSLPVNQEVAREHAEGVQARKLFLTPVTASAIKRASETTLLHALVLCCIDMGTRINEANGALRDDLDLSEGPFGILYIRNQVQRFRKKGDKTSRLHNGAPKSRKGYRPLLLSLELRQLILMRLEKMERGELPYSPYLFANSKGNPHSYSTIHEAFSAICQRAGVHLPRGNATHVMRRFFLNTARDSGVSEEVQSQVAGHQRYETTALVYQDVDQVAYSQLFTFVQNLTRDDGRESGAADSARD